MPTSQISTPLKGVDAAVVIAALHNHDLMIKTVCPALVSYAFQSGDKATSATYTITDKKPIGQVCPNPLLSQAAKPPTLIPDYLHTHLDQRARRCRLARQR